MKAPSFTEPAVKSPAFGAKPKTGAQPIPLNINLNQPQAAAPAPKVAAAPVVQAPATEAAADLSADRPAAPKAGGAQGIKIPDFLKRG